MIVAVVAHTPALAHGAHQQRQQQRSVPCHIQRWWGSARMHVGTPCRCRALPGGIQAQSPPPR
jgi:hypothetical protein